MWSEELVNAPNIPRDIPVNQIIVTTVETIRNIAIMMLLTTHNKHSMFVGPTGTGKSVYITVSKFKLSNNILHIVTLAVSIIFPK